MKLSMLKSLKEFFVRLDVKNIMKNQLKIIMLDTLKHLNIKRMSKYII